MRHDEYRRLHTTCLAMADQSDTPEIKARWLAMAEAWLKSATELHELSSGGVEGQASAVRVR
jgi:hypothetical protein